jgi:membrane fusion protein, multidrug efflux system
MKQIALIISLFLFAACAPKGDDAKKAELDSYRNKVEQYNSKIAELEAELEGEADESESAYRVPVEVKTLRPEKFSRYFEVTGSMEAVQDAYISPEINGQIQKVAVRRGARVRKGDLLIKLNSD